MSSGLYPQSISRNLIRITGHGYHENRGMPDMDTADRRTLKDYAGLTLATGVAFLPPSVSLTPLQVRWLGQ